MVPLAGVLVLCSASFIVTQLNCCLTGAVTLPHVICIPPPTDPPLLYIPCGQVFCYASTRATDSQREIHKPCAAERAREREREKKKSGTSAYSSVKNGVICKVCMRGFLTVPCCFVSAAHAAGTGIPYCLPGHWPGSAGGGFLAP